MPLVEHLKADAILGKTSENTTGFFLFCDTPGITITKYSFGDF